MTGQSNDDVFRVFCRESPLNLLRDWIHLLARVIVVKKQMSSISYYSCRRKSTFNMVVSVMSTHQAIPFSSISVASLKRILSRTVASDKVVYGATDLLFCWKLLTQDLRNILAIMDRYGRTSKGDGGHYTAMFAWKDERSNQDWQSC